jgi:hypothetical protein
MEVLAIIGAAAAAGWYISLRRHPYTRCRWCGGTSRNAGSTRNRWGTCKHCGGTGKRERFGAKWVHR